MGIDGAAKKLSDASYPFLKGIDWTSDIYLKPLPGANVKDVLKAVDKAIVMGSSMDGNLLKAAAEAHHKAIGSIDGKGVTSAADYEAVTAALGKVIASVPQSKVMDVQRFCQGCARRCPEQAVLHGEPPGCTGRSKSLL